MTVIYQAVALRNSGLAGYQLNLIRIPKQNLSHSETGMTPRHSIAKAMSKLTGKVAVVTGASSGIRGASALAGGAGHLRCLSRPCFKLSHIIIIIE
jgi:hypothetical protein